MLRALNRLVEILAILSGLILFALVLMTLGNLLFLGFFDVNIAGTYELVEQGTAAAIALTFPLIQLNHAHIGLRSYKSSDQHLCHPFRTIGILLTMAGVTGLLFYAAIGGLFSQYDPIMPSLSTILGLPLWWTYLPVLTGFGLAFVIAFMQLAQEFHAVLINQKALTQL
jgi:TRAP-type C4-dicarboxylate transport system permease small subunit